MYNSFKTLGVSSLASPLDQSIDQRGYGRLRIQSRSNVILITIPQRTWYWPEKMPSKHGIWLKLLPWALQAIARMRAAHWPFIFKVGSGVETSKAR